MLLDFSSLENSFPPNYYSIDPNKLITFLNRHYFFHNKAIQEEFISLVIKLLNSINPPQNLFSRHYYLPFILNSELHSLAFDEAKLINYCNSKSTVSHISAFSFSSFGIPGAIEYTKSDDSEKSVTEKPITILNYNNFQRFRVIDGNHRVSEVIKHASNNHSQTGKPVSVPSIFITPEETIKNDLMFDDGSAFLLALLEDRLFFSAIYYARKGTIRFPFTEKLYFKNHSLIYFLAKQKELI